MSGWGNDDEAAALAYDEYVAEALADRFEAEAEAQAAAADAAAEEALDRQERKRLGMYGVLAGPGGPTGPGQVGPELVADDDEDEF